MPLTLHAAFVPQAQQILGGMRGIVDKAEAHCAEHVVDASELLEAKLAETMWPLPYHVRAAWVHSAFALELYKTGEFSPDFTELPGDWDAIDIAENTIDSVRRVVRAKQEPKARIVDRSFNPGFQTTKGEAA